MQKMKMLKFFLLFNLALFIHAILPAQEQTITLKGKSIDLPDNPYQVVEVIDAREEKCYLGYVNYLINENKWINVPVTIKPDLSESVLSLFKPGFTDTSTKKSLVIKINRLFVYDLNEKNGLLRVIEINIDFYSKENGIYYHEYTAGHYTNSAESNSNQKVKNMIVFEIEYCFIEFLHHMKNGLGYHQIVDEQKLNENSINKEIFVNTSSHHRKNGIYYTFNGFRDNLADTITDFFPKVIAESNTNYLKFKFKSKEIDKNEIWGLFYENQLYIQIAEIFIPVDVNNNDYIIHNMPSFLNDISLAQGAGVGFLLFGTVGALVVGAIDAATNQWIIMDDDYKLDLATGMPIPLDEPAYRKFAGELIFFAEKYKGQNPELFVNGKKTGSFRPKSYISVVVPKENNMVEICLKTDNDKFCKTASVDIFNTKYYEVKIKENGQVKFMPITAENMKSSKQKKIDDSKFLKIDSAIQ